MPRPQNGDDRRRNAGGVSHRAERRTARRHQGSGTTTRSAHGSAKRAAAGNSDGDPLLTVGQAAERLGTPERFVRRLIAERRIEFVKFGEARCSPVRIRVSVLDDFIAASTVRPTE
jgi:excisionase family DNA binding protein